MIRMRAAPIVLLAATIGAACSSDSVATGPSSRNLHPMTPRGWSSLGGVGAATVIVGIDNITTHTGHGSLAILGTDTNSLFYGGIAQYIKARPLRGKRVRLTAWFKGDSLRSVAFVKIYAHGLKSRVVQFDNMSTRPILGTAEWHQIQIVLDVPESAVGIALGALMSGKGEIWVDDIVFEVVAATGPTTDLLIEPVASAIDAASLYANAARGPTNLNFEP